MTRVVRVGLAALVLSAGVGGCAPAPAPAPGDAAVVAAERDAAVARADADREAAVRDAAAARLQAEAAAADKLAADRWRAVRAAAFNAAVVALCLVPVLGLVAAVGYGLKRRAVWLPRKADGALPFRSADLHVEHAMAALAARHAAELALASQQPVPQTLTYSPRSEYRNNTEVTGAEPLALPAAAPVAFRDLELVPHAVYLGAAEGGPVVRPWDQLLTVGLGGLTGSGKTWTAVSLTLQALAAGHRVVLADPHSANPESLAARLAPARALLWRPVATTDAEISAAVVGVERVMRDRAEGRDADLTPVTFVLDEFTKVMRGPLGEAVARILQGITQEGRKLGVRAVLLGQRWSASSTGGTADLRDTIPDVLLHRMRRTDARMLTGWPIDDLPDTSSLAPGVCYLLSDDGVVKVTQPRMSAADVAAFTAGLAGCEPGAAPVQVPALGASPHAADTRPAPGAAPGAAPGDEDGRFRVQVLDLFRAGDAVAEITDALSGTTNRNSTKWRTTRSRVEDALREALS